MPGTGRLNANIGSCPMVKIDSSHACVLLRIITTQVVGMQNQKQTSPGNESKVVPFQDRPHAIPSSNPSRAG